MKKYIIYSAVAISAIGILTMGGTAFAENAPVLISENNLLADDLLKTESNYSIISGTVKAITENSNGSVRIEFTSTEIGEIILNETADGCVIVDGSKLSDFSSLKIGAKVTVAMDNSAPMAMSYPGQTSGAAVFIVNNDKSVTIDKFNSDLVGNKVAIKIGQDTQIIDAKGTKQGEDDVMNRECLVIYGVATKSIPAQTTPDFVIILDNEQKETGTTTDEVKLVELRKTFEGMGYSVIWTSNNEPITITNGTNSAKITIGSKAVIFDDKEIVLSSEAELIEGVTHVPSDIINLFNK